MSSDTHIISDEPVALAGAGLSLAGPRDFFQLMKPRVMSLVIFTAIIGLVVAPGSLPLFNSIIAIAFIAVGAGASGALNMWYDADIDAQMTRTKKRPLPRGVMAPGTALTFGFLLSVVSVWMLALATNYVAAGLLAFTIFFYVVIYTMLLKRRTPQNIVIGGAPGALPPMIGYAAVTGTVTIDSLILFLIIFIWTPPHFWALALYKLSDYGRVGIPMMPNVAGPKSTRNQIFGYSVVLAAVAAAPVFTGLSGSVYAFGALLLNIGFVALAFKVWRSRAGEKDEVQPESLYEVQKGDRDARNLFAFSILYLFAMFALIGVDYLLRGSL
jgi:protoheme IX farnesyltransferase